MEYPITFWICMGFLRKFLLKLWYHLKNFILYHWENIHVLYYSYITNYACWLSLLTWCFHKNIITEIQFHFGPEILFYFTPLTPLTMWTLIFCWFLLTGLLLFTLIEFSVYNAYHSSWKRWMIKYVSPGRIVRKMGIW